MPNSTDTFGGEGDDWPDDLGAFTIGPDGLTFTGTDRRHRHSATVTDRGAIPLGREHKGSAEARRVRVRAWLAVLAPGVEVVKQERRQVVSPTHREAVEAWCAAKDRDLSDWQAYREAGERFHVGWRVVRRRVTEARKRAARGPTRGPYRPGSDDASTGEGSRAVSVDP